MDDVAKKQQINSLISRLEALIANEYPALTSQVKETLLSD
jgi:hypothetical protein